MIFSGASIAAATGGRLVRDGAPGPVVIDSRAVRPGNWFVALRGDRFDGHEFLPQVAAAGAAGAVVRTIPDGWKGGLVVVADPLVALQDLARSVRRGFDGPVVGITGTAGKTSTRVMVVDVLRERGRVHHTEGNLNNHVGLPLTLCATPPDAEMIVLELGMNHPGEIALLQDIAAPDLRLITNVGAAHLEGCGSIDGVAAAKQELFDGARPGDVLLVNDDDRFIRAMATPAQTRVIHYGRGDHNLIRLTDVAVDPDRLQTRLRLETPDGVVRAILGTPGAHLAENALAAVAVGYVLRVPNDRIGPALGRYQPEGMRNRVVRLNGVLLVEDAYNANPVSVAAALRTLASLPGRRIAVLGDMLELGASEAQAHRDLLALARALPIQRILVTGERMSAAVSGKGIEVFPDVDSLSARLAEEIQVGDTLLVKGSRGSRMERVLEAVRTRLAEDG